ncbi:MAG: family 10 glycosylhydrolase [Armatimonadetes bacterium]|nr:family 10 glycosylhydrolase [Armatimonadota bacterium]
MLLRTLPAILAGCLCYNALADAPIEAPEPMREFRAAWVATVANIDWPSKPGLPAAQQKAEMVRILDRCVELRLNAVVFQVRPACDAMYASTIEPWSEYLTGAMGKAPSPPYDPLEFAIEQAHERGLELHAWFNPYRAKHLGSRSAVSAGHVSRKRPEIVRTYGTSLWLDPGDPATAAYSLSVVMDVVRRYDVDGVHFDDYFYPYKVKDPAGAVVDFPDSETYARYKANGGSLPRDDWRRANVDDFVRSVYAEIKRAKPWVRFGVSPFGIWRPGNPPQIRGFDAYAEIYADSLRWLRNGWVDYWTPQLYWPIEAKAQSYPVLLKWWAEQNSKGRHLWPGLYTSRVQDGSATQWQPDQVTRQVEATRAQPGATGHVHFSMVALMGGRGDLGAQLKQRVYAAPALVPATPWLGGAAPAKPTIRTTYADASPAVSISSGASPWLWLVQWKHGGDWFQAVLPGAQRVARAPQADVDAVVVRGVSRLGALSAPAAAPVRPP